jgi:hypothetical protein
LETGQAPNALTAEHPTERATPENRTYQLLTILRLAWRSRSWLRTFRSGRWAR